jgi:hypothetical protein
LVDGFSSRAPGAFALALFVFLLAGVFWSLLPWLIRRSHLYTVTNEGVTVRIFFSASLLFPVLFPVLFPALFLPLLLAQNVFADELILSQKTFRELGYLPVSQSPSPATQSSSAALTARLASLQPATKLSWPVEFVDPAHTVAQNFFNFQMYDPSSAYFHGGCDLRANGHGNVRASDAGILEGGFYGYVAAPDGSLQKQWQAWNGHGRHDPYFELAVVRDDGVRFEYHHIDSEDLPANIIQALNQGNTRIQAGDVIGKVNAWAFAEEEYSHIHYNMIRPDKVNVNPEYYSVSLPDHTAPKILGVYGIDANGTAHLLANSRGPTERWTEFVVATTDSHDGDAYVQTPPYVSISFAAGGNFTWDFRQALILPSGQFPKIWDVFEKSLYPVDTKTGKSLPPIETVGQYGTGEFLIRLPIKSTDSGPFTITVGDVEGNSTFFRSSLVP